jgi:hypothetical protein
MPRPRLPIPLSTKKLLKLSDSTPSGLEWTDSEGTPFPGEPAGSYRPVTGFYIVLLNGTEYQAHRLVYYLRTGKDPGENAVSHLPDNPEKDNRKELVLVDTYGGRSKEPSKTKSQMRLVGHLFRYVQNIEQLSDQELEKWSYYRGYPCPHGHTIRDVDYHWCYDCARKIRSNICGFDVNYLHEVYKVRYESLWKTVQIGSFSSCWNSSSARKRICFPSYRSLWSKQKAEHMSINKLIYHSTWGDVGSLRITQLCGNPDCINPLHLRSRFNTNLPPKSIIPFETKFEYSKLFLAAQYENDGCAVDVLTQKQFKNSITSPKIMEYPEE